jgi:hypothetical protein
MQGLFSYMEKDLFPYFGVMAPPTPPWPFRQGEGEKIGKFFGSLFQKELRS